jgi:hydrogenase maturation factor
MNAREPDACSTRVTAEPGCITCGDVAVVLTVVEVEGADARCRDDDGRTEIVAIELLDAVTPGDRVLVHAGVALAPAQTAVEAGG